VADSLDPRDVAWKYSEAAEQAVLSAVLIDPGALSRLRSIVAVADFFVERHRHLYKAMLGLADRGDVVDPLTLSTELGDAGLLEASGGKEYIGFLVDAVPTAANVESHASIVVERAKRRLANKALHDSAKLLRDGSADAAQIAERLRPALDALAATSRTSKRNGPLRVRSDVELEQLPPMAWLADGILPLGGLAAIYGAPGAGKSFLSLDLAFSIGTGVSWCGREIVHGGALYVAGEGDAGLSQRIVAWKSAHRVLGEAVGVGVITDPIDLLKPLDVARIVTAAKAPHVGQPLRLIVIDTLARAMVGGDENDTRDMSTVIAAADRIRDETGAAVLLVHHTSKNSDQERGSSALRGAVDTLLFCEDGDDGRQLVCAKQKDAEAFSPIPFRLVAGHGSCVVQAADSPEVAREQAGVMNPKRFQALRVLRESFTDRGATTTEWFEASNLTRRTFFRTRTWLVDAGYVAEGSRGGRYTVTLSGKVAQLPSATGAKPVPTPGATGGLENPFRGFPPRHPPVGSAGSESGTKDLKRTPPAEDDAADPNYWDSPEPPGD